MDIKQNAARVRELLEGMESIDRRSAEAKDTMLGEIIRRTVEGAAVVGIAQWAQMIGRTKGYTSKLIDAWSQRERFPDMRWTERVDLVGISSAKLEAIQRIHAEEGCSLRVARYRYEASQKTTVTDVLEALARDPDLAAKAVSNPRIRRVLARAARRQEESDAETTRRRRAERNPQHAAVADFVAAIRAVENADSDLRRALRALQRIQGQTTPDMQMQMLDATKAVRRSVDAIDAVAQAGALDEELRSMRL
ncbi:MAG: hypothetical protein WAT66_14670 [Actinomycetota bacterium]